MSHIAQRQFTTETIGTTNLPTSSYESKADTYLYFINLCSLALQKNSVEKRELVGGVDVTNLTQKVKSIF